MKDKIRRWTPILKRLPPGPVTGVEVGVNQGRLSAELLRGNPDLFLWLVDIKPRGGALEKTAFAKGRRKHIWLPSVEAVREFEDSSLDFVFIDADHSKKAVEADIAAWQPKVKPGGWLCGHDYGKPPCKSMAVTEVVDATFPRAEIDRDCTWFVLKKTATGY